jgi:hypothetical protein
MDGADIEAIISCSLWRNRERDVLCLPGLDQLDERVQAIALRRIAPGVHQAFDFLERGRGRGAS